MALNKKNIVTVIVFTGLLVPFILMTDLFPFVRFGMFAEPIKRNIQTEKFIVYYNSNERKKVLLNPEDVGVNGNAFQYMLRNYYYRNQLDEFSGKLKLSVSGKIRELEFYRIVSDQTYSRPDTVLIYRYKMP